MIAYHLFLPFHLFIPLSLYLCIYQANKSRNLSLSLDLPSSWEFRSDEYDVTD